VVQKKGNLLRYLGKATRNGLKEGATRRRKEIPKGGKRFWGGGGGSFIGRRDRRNRWMGKEKRATKTDGIEKSARRACELGSGGSGNEGKKGKYRSSLRGGGGTAQLRTEWKGGSCGEGKERRRNN